MEKSDMPDDNIASSSSDFPHSLEETEDVDGSKEDILDWDDDVDEIALKDAELSHSESDKERLKEEAEEIKNKANIQFKNGEFRDSALTYTQGLRICPLKYDNDRAVLYSNRAASKMKLGYSKSALEDCNKALELNPHYIKALWRRVQLFEGLEKLDEALEDCKKILEIDPTHKEAHLALQRLPDQIQIRNEKLKGEMLSKLKDLGNLFLRPFGLSTENFQVNQDPESGSYSVNFKQ